MTLTLTPLINLPLVKPGDSLEEMLWSAILEEHIRLESGDILVLAQKIISKSEGRLVNLTQVKPGKKALKLAEICHKDPRFVEMVLRESNRVLRKRVGTIIVEHRLGFVCANAGIDHSNVEGSWGNTDDWVLLLPADPDASAERIRHFIEEKAGIGIGILIIDSHGRAWRNGTVGISIGMSGVPGLVDLRGREDLFGFKLMITQVGAADELAAAASLVMGQAGERIPAVHVRGFPYPLRKSTLTELIRPRELDMFR
ncbi:MAG: coenzyme F420-0:L-glutamate ligase [Anaerolinea sp.]|nr:coenzyme F420-0:L-glutamate ligase [Anaerolinea sp.]